LAETTLRISPIKVAIASVRDETPELMPAPIYYARRLVERQACARTAACPSCALT